MSKETTTEEEFGNYVANISSINRKILRLLFDIEIKKNNDLEKEVESIKNHPKIEENLFFFEGTLDFGSMIILLKKSINKNKLLILLKNKDNFNDNEKNESNIFKNYLKKSLILRNDIWHNNVDFQNYRKYINVITAIKKSYEMLKNNESLNKKELFEKAIKYIDIVLEFLENNDKKNQK